MHIKVQQMKEKYGRIADKKKRRRIRQLMEGKHDRVLKKIFAVTSFVQKKRKYQIYVCKGDKEDFSIQFWKHTQAECGEQFEVKMCEKRDNDDDVHIVSDCL